ncbi:hypothetical protein [Mucilaginibacter sp. CSA2-8R]|uniref:HD domain-containing protein n=1 Tax=Mucilaginibacter sp. CSA2-8R TaxID=3141542 RepID=UPI00315D0CBE
MNLGSFRTLEEYFKSIDENIKLIFPHDDKYVTRYNYLSHQLNTWIHPYVVKGGMTVDGGYLNDHGPEHISKVILRASQLVKNSDIILSEYETYILLMSIHIHDVGNILGRVDHEINSLSIIQKFGIHAGHDRIEWECIFEIAEAHGGHPKDKISDLAPDTILDFEVRKPLLAAILKLADELAEDRSRASRFELQNGLLPELAEIYHRYSHCLHSTVVDIAGRQIKLSFDVEEKDLCKLFKKKVKDAEGERVIEVYLINEIYERTYKTHLERMYCMRFTRPELQINKIRVDITITTDKMDHRNKPIKKQISYDIGEVGYPSTASEGIFSICPTLSEFTGEKICRMSIDQCLTNVTATY